MNWVITGSGNGLSPVRCQAITWPNADLLSIGLSATNLSEIWIKMQNLSFMKTHLKMLSVKWQPFCPGWDELKPSSAGPVYIWDLNLVITLLKMSPQCSQCWAISRHSANPWWHHQMETFSALLALCPGNSPVTGEFPGQRPVTRSFDVFLDLPLNKRLSKQSWGWWFETPSASLWCHCNVWMKRDRYCSYPWFPIYETSLMEHGICNVVYAVW